MPQQEQEPQSQRKGAPAGWRYPVQAKHRARLRGWLAQVWRGAKNNAALVSLVGVALTLLVTTVLTQQGWVNQQRLENQRAQAAARVAEQQAQQESLQAYLDQMSGLLLERDLRASEEDSEVRSLARAKTLTVLLGLDAQSKRILLQFLIEAELVQRVDGRDSIISLRYANLSDADLSGAFLRGAKLSDANLSDANLSDAYLSNANVLLADLSNANLRYANLSNADLSHANLRGATLEDADLSYANLRGVDLRGTSLIFADLSRANLRRANLQGATGLSDEKIAAVASLEGATMPDGSEHP